MIPIGCRTGAACFVYQAVFGGQSTTFGGPYTSSTEVFETVCFANSGEFRLEGMTKIFGTPKAVLSPPVSLTGLRQVLANSPSKERDKALVAYVELMKETLKANRSLFDREMAALRALSKSPEGTRAIKTAYSLLFPRWLLVRPAR
ncbi:MAG TPA: hypothetical protein VFX30_00070 [bacterium]|nr:hypothetical protein [bacterium]